MVKIRFNINTRQHRKVKSLLVSIMCTNVNRTIWVWYVVQTLAWLRAFKSLIYGTQQCRFSVIGCCNSKSFYINRSSFSATWFLCLVHYRNKCLWYIMVIGEHFEKTQTPVNNIDKKVSNKHIVCNDMVKLPMNISTTSSFWK